MRNSTNKDKYEILHRIGQGSHGTVHKGIDRETGKICAIKKLSISNDFQCLTNEIKILSDCKHKNIVRFLASDCYDSELWIVMEYCYGGSVRDVINYLGPLTEQQILVIVRDVLSGLDYLHSKQKIHRDVKAANILLTRDGFAKLGDFGVSEPVDTDPNNLMKGTILWLPPEVVTTPSQKSGPAIDIWSLGITIVEMAETQPPYKNRDIDEVFQMLRNPLEQSPTFQNLTKWSKEMINLLSLCLKKNANERSNASELIKHDAIKNAPSNEIIVELVEQVCTNNITKPGLSKTIYEQAESLVKEGLVLVNICKERRNKVLRFNQMDRELTSYSRKFNDQQSNLKELNARIERMKLELEDCSREKNKLERQRNDLQIDLNNKRERKLILTKQLDQYRDKRMRKETEEAQERLRYETEEAQKKMKLMSLGTKSG